MPGILYKLPKVASSNNYKQKGPTCWYYAVKALIELHKFREYPEFEKLWQQLHLVRKQITKLKSETGTYDLESVKGSVNDIKKLAENFKTRYDSLESRVSLLKQQRFTHIAHVRDELKKLKTEMQRAGCKEYNALGVAKESAKKLDELQDMERINILIKFLPAVFSEINYENNQLNMTLIDLK